MAKALGNNRAGESGGTQNPFNLVQLSGQRDKAQCSKEHSWQMDSYSVTQPTQYGTSYKFCTHESSGFWMCLQYI